LPNLFPVLRKFFPLDKNYLLEEAQLQVQEELLLLLIEKVKIAYEQHHNPLGLTDTFSTKIKKYAPKKLKALQEFYQNLAGVYRLKWGDSQLEFVWDGRDHTDKYKEEWAQFFTDSITRFCHQDLFIQAVLDLTVFLPATRAGEADKIIQLKAGRMNHFMMQHFEVKLHKSKGLMKMKVA
jgi:hypothetical protein